MRKHINLLIAFIASVLFIAFPRDARADSKVGSLVQQLKSSDDFRVRTQAALALGVTGDDAAVKPLCDALSDDKGVVKQSAAAALEKLAKTGGLTCIKAALAKETDAKTKKQFEKAYKGLLGTAPPPPPGKDTKYYVAIEVTNKSTRQLDEVDAMVRSVAQSHLLGMDGYAVAPKGETAAEAGKVLKGKKISGYYLIASVEAPVYKDKNLTQVVNVSLWTYPKKVLKGQFAPKRTQEETPTTDLEGEKILIKMCSESAVNDIAKVIESMR